jgi:threonyl-tRNA synthetase
VEKGLISVRERGRRDRGAMPLEELIHELSEARYPPIPGPAL